MGLLPLVTRSVPDIVLRNVHTRPQSVLEKISNFSVSSESTDVVVEIPPWNRNLVKEGH